ncbi:MAG: hypothetical protein IT308_01930 [Anaerolineaceae bacterium]|nr:hypothetical protein [Anaerolineaceae bacterium]
MDKQSTSTPTRKTRIGLHYFPDMLHFRDCDLQTWLPRLKSMEISWLSLRSPADRAIPESFIYTLVQENIEPIIQFNLNLGAPPSVEEIQPILDAYARWGVKNILFFERPNSPRSWPSSDWAQTRLVERFLDQFLPLANAALRAGLRPLLPPLESGGGYWATTFFRAMLESLIQRKETHLLENLTISAYGWTHGRPLNWGAGGPERWPEARPYNVVAGSQDQQGFRSFDWYQAISRALLGKSLPIILFEAGAGRDPLSQPTQTPPNIEETSILAIARLLEGEQFNDPADPSSAIEPLPEEIIACNFWLLSADTYSPFQAEAWFQQDGSHVPLVEKWLRWVQQKRNQKTALSQPGLQQSSFTPTAQSNDHPIAHYLLLPVYEWGIADWHLEVIHPFVKKYQPTIGFSLQEASLAARVTVIGNEQTFSENLIERLRIGGAIVERISGSGTSIATQLQRGEP